MSTRVRELPNLHCHFDRWIDAAADGRLSAEQEHVLNRHVTGCTHCMRRCQSEKVLQMMEARLEREGAFDAAFETRLVVGFQSDIDYECSRQKESPVPLRLRLLLSIAALLIIVMHVVDLDPGQTAATHPIADTVRHLILHSPDYHQIPQTAMVAIEDALPLAALHKIVSLLSETIAWIVLALGVRHFALNWLRRRADRGDAGSADAYRGSGSRRPRAVPLP